MGLSLLSIPLTILAVLTLVVLIDEVVGPFLFLNGRATIADFQLVIFIPMAILVMSVLQWLLLRRYLPYAGVWIPLTVLGWLCGISLFYLAWLAGFRAPVEWNATIALPVFGALAGGSQWLYLRRVIHHGRAGSGYWVLASTVGYGMICFVSLGLFNGTLEFFFFILAPFLITGLALFLLLRQNAQTGEEGRTIPSTDSLTGEQQSIWLRRLTMVMLAGLLLLLFFFAGSWIYATGQLTLARAEGIYATPEEAMTQKLIKGVGGSPVERVEILGTGINDHNGSLPRVLYVRAWVFADQRPNGKPTPRGYGVGSCFLRVEDGWVHMSEGAFPEFVGWVMELYGMEGA